MSELEELYQELKPKVQPAAKAIIQLFRDADVHPWVGAQALIKVLGVCIVDSEDPLRHLEIHINILRREVDFILRVKEGLAPEGATIQ